MTYKLIAGSPHRGYSLLGQVNGTPSFLLGESLGAKISPLRTVFWTFVAPALVDLEPFGNGVKPCFEC